MRSVLFLTLCLFTMPLVAAPADMLIMAVKQGDIAKATKALSDGADINAKVQDKAAINYAALHGDHAMFAFLIDNGSVISENDSLYQDAVEGGSMQIVQHLLQSNIDPASHGDYSRPHPIIIAVQKGNVEMVELLVKKVKDINTIGVSYNSPLSNAVQNRKADIVKCLLQHGANINDGEVDGKSLITLAVENDDIETVKLLVDSGAVLNTERNQPLWAAANKKNAAIASLLIANGADPNVMSPFNGPLLMHAMMFSSTQFVKLLLDHGVKPELAHVSGDDVTYLHAAAVGGYTDIVKASLDAGMSIELPGPEETTPLMCACNRDNVETVRYLLSRKAKVNAKTSTGFTPLFIAAREGSTGVVKLLLAHGADVNLSGDKGWTPLMAASRYGHVDIVKLLIANKANVNASGIFFVTALWLAQESGHNEIVRMLKKAGAR